jgi:hypothetical protein
MTEQEFKAVYPLIAGWMRTTIDDHAQAAQSVASLGVKRLPHYYDELLLSSSKVVFVATVPVPPLSALGMDRFDEFERMNPAGINPTDNLKTVICAVACA